MYYKICDMKNLYLPVTVQKKHPVVAAAILLLSLLFFAPPANASGGKPVKKQWPKKASSLGAPTISYTSPQTYYVGHTIAPLTPTSSGVAGLTYKSTSVTLGGSYSAMCAPAFDAAGNMYLAAQSKTAVNEIPADGSAVVTIASGFTNVNCLAFDQHGNLYVSDAGSGFSTPGAVFEITAGSHALITIKNNMLTPGSLAIDAAGNIFVGQSTGTGLLEIKTGGTTTNIGTGFYSIGGLAIDAAGFLYIADGNSPWIWRVSPDYTTFTKYAFGNGEDWENPTGLAIDAGGNLFVGDQGTHLVQLIPPGGNTAIVIGGIGTPYGMSVDGKGVAYLADNTQSAIFEIVPTGGYHLNKPLPAGLSFDDATGIISGTPTTITPATDYQVTAYNGSGGTTATVNIGVQPVVVNLTALGISAGALSPVFATGTTSYTDAVSNATASVTLTPTASTFSTVTVNGASVNSGSASASIPLSVGSNAVTVVVTGSDGVTTKTYTVTVVRAPSSDAHLAGLSLEPVTISPAFSPDVFTYNLTVLLQDSVIHFEPFPADAGATVTLNGGLLPPSTVAFYLSKGMNTFSLLVTAADGVTQLTYTININRVPSTEAHLAGLSVNTATLSPNFDANVLSYTASAAASTTSVTITPSLMAASASITVNGVQVANHAASSPIALNAGSTTITVVVTAQDGSTTITYTVVVTRGSIATLSNLSLSNTSISPAFAPATTSYSASVGNLVRSKTITVTPTLTDPAASVTVNGIAVASGTASSPIYLNVGANTISVAVTAADGSAMQTYTITVTRAASIDANLASISPGTGPLTPAFDPNTTIYTISVKNAVSSMTVKAIVDDANATMTVNGVTLASGTTSQPAALAEGASTTITIKVTAENTGVKQTYTITVTRAPSPNASLAAIGPSITPLTPSFSPATTSYTLSTGNATASMTLKPTAGDVNATITVNGTSVSQGTLSQGIALAEGTATTVNVTVTAQDGTTSKTYTLNVTRAPSVNATLARMSLSSGTFSPAFNPATLSYTSAVPNSTSTIKVTPTATDANATITVNGTTVTTGTASGTIALNVGANTITTVVTSQSGTVTKTYTVTITRAPSINANLASMSPSVAPLSPAFAPATLSYTLAVKNTITSMTVKPVTSDATATMTVNGTALASGATSAPIALAVGANTINVVVIAQDGKTSKSYTITATRAPGGIDSFDPGISVNKPTESSTMAEDGILVHPGISPNGDGVNDFLAIDNISQYPDNKLTIMNRSGQLIYEAKGYDNSSKTFDGHSNKNGQMQLPGTYFYQLDYTVGGIIKHKTGFIILKY